MTRFRYRPYEELRLVRGTRDGEGVLEVPWLRVEFRHRIPNDHFKQISQALETKDGSAPKLMQMFLASFKQYPIWYAEGEALNDARFLFSQLRREHLLALVESEARPNLLSRLKGYSPTSEAFRREAAKFLRQNLFLSTRVEAALITALELAGPGREALVDFIESERGHDTFFERAIEALGYDPDELEIETPVLALIESFKAAAGKSFLAVASLIDCCERTSDGPSHPLSDLLAQRGFPAAARNLALHREINQRENHSSVGFEMIQNHPNVSPSEAEECVRLVRSGSRALIATMS